MKKIEKLTPEQEVNLIEFRKKWLDVGLCCEPANFEKAEEQITFFYEKLGKKKPMFFRFSSPLTCELGYHAIVYIMQNKEKILGDNLWANLRANLGDNLGDNLWANLWDNLGANLRDNLGDNLWANLWDNLGDNLGDNLWANLRDNLGDNLRANLGDNLWANLRDNLWANLWANLRDNLGDNLWANLWDNLGDNLRANLGDNLRANLGDNLRDNLRDNLKNKNFQFINTNLWGQMDVPWIAFYKFMETIGIKYKADEIKLLNAWGSLSESACWWMPWENICIISDRPVRISKDESGRLHNETKAACEFRDGYGVYSWHGVNIPDEWITNKKKLTPEIALRWPNVEQRRAACEIIGWANVLEHPSLNPKIIDEDQPHIGTLMQVDLPDAPQQWFLKYYCGTGRVFAESVNDKSFNTALKANAGGNGWRGIGNPEDFIPFTRT